MQSWATITELFDNLDPPLLISTLNKIVKLVKIMTKENVNMGMIGGLSMTMMTVFNEITCCMRKRERGCECTKHPK